MNDRSLSTEEIWESLLALHAAGVVLRRRCRELLERVPPSADELDEEEDLPEIPGAATLVRATVGAVLHDHLDPLVATLVALTHCTNRTRGRE